MNKSWLLPQEVPSDVQEALATFGLIERQILFRRGITTSYSAESFLAGEVLDDDDPFILHGMDAAVERVLKAIREGEQIVVYGDYDADGVTATALLVEHIHKLGGVVQHYIPNRFDEGYGLNHEALTGIQDRGAGLVITVDCGIRAIQEVEYAVGLGLDMIVTDHHHPGQSLPPALAVLNPKQSDSAYPFAGLSGVGLAYKLAQGLNRRLGIADSAESLDLVAIGTVADLAPLEHENRYLVRAGLRQISQGTRVGLRVMANIAGFQLDRLNTTTIGFGIGPRLNAAGRLDTAENAYHLLIENDEDEAKRLADLLEASNRERQQITHKTLEKVRNLGVGEEGIPDLIFVVDPEFNEGVVGLAASRLTDEFYRPAVVAVLGDEVTRASGRSIPEFHITEALEACSDLLDRFGGHSLAAGFSVANENLDALETRLHQLAANRFSGMDLRPSLEIDAVVPFRILDWPLFEFIEQIEPCGEGNPVPVFAAASVQVIEKRAVGKNGQHLKLSLRQEGKTFDAIAFRQGDLKDKLPDLVDIAFRLERNDYWNYPTLELNVIDIHPTGHL
ncbi:MAG: single-stranded-DNA-specific exonuclease RecJ [Anaerolineales bacterium]|nr:single-stranded-DNA-specific exonuclease RecJ [Anaerolineales bacterium]